MLHKYTSAIIYYNWDKKRKEKESDQIKNLYLAISSIQK